MKQTIKRKPAPTHKPKRTPTQRNKVRQVVRFLPAVFLFLLAFTLHNTTAFSPAVPKNTEQVLSYATSISVGDLLAHTNSQRSANGVASLSLNGQLNNAAQAKANDMVARDYWSHTTPDGQQPWVFMTQAGYQYKTAGENLAYGFATSADTVTGWMNSPPHRQNLLNSSFVDVGFGFANSPNYVGSGEETVVVAMYASPLSGQSTPPPASPPASTNSTTPQTQNQTTAPVETPAAEPIQTAPEASAPTQETPTETTEQQKQETEQKALSEVPTAETTNVRRIQILTGGNARWSSTLLIASVCAIGVLWALQRGRQLRHLLISGEHYIMKHVHIDFTVIGFVVLGWTLLQTSGTVR